VAGKPEMKRPLGRPRCRWEDNIRMDLRETGSEVVHLDLCGTEERPMTGSCEPGNES
jgi:hypothetical protein